MSLGIGLRIFTQIERPARELVEQFADLPTSNINDEMNRLFCMDAGIKPYNDLHLIGTAVTVKAPVGDNLMFHRALDLAEPGDVVVVDGAGALERSLAGEMMITYAEKRGLAGLVVDGALRDLDGIRSAKIPIYTRGINPQGPFKNGPGEINVPISCGGQVVFPGDILVGDEDGIVVIRPEWAEEILAKAKAKYEQECKKLENFAAHGANVEQHTERFKGALEKLGVKYY